MQMALRFYIMPNLSPNSYTPIENDDTFLICN
jgi:hypothetical protein